MNVFTAESMEEWAFNKAIQIQCDFATAMQTAAELGVITELPQCELLTTAMLKGLERALEKGREAHVYASQMSAANNN